PDQAGQLEHLLRNERFGLLLVAGQVELLNLLRLGFIPVAANEGVVEVLVLRAHAADVERHSRPGQVTQMRDVLLLADGDRTGGASRFHTSRQISMISRVRASGRSYGTPWKPSMTCGPDAPSPMMQRPSDSASTPAAVIASKVGVRE